MGEPAENQDVYVPESGKVAIRDPDGSVWKIPQVQLAEAQHQGARPATEAEYFGAVHGKAGDVAAATVGAARGATFGVFDPAFVEATRAALGDEKAEEYRNTMRLLKQASPNASLGGEIAGAVAPAMFGAPAAGGGLALGESAIARFGTHALAAAPRAVVEGAAIGLGGQLSEDTLQNHKMHGEAYLSAGVKGGAIGLLLGAGGAGILGAAGDKAGTLFGRGERSALQAEESLSSRLVRAEEGAPYRAAAAHEVEAAGETGARKPLMSSVEDLRDQLTYKATGANRTDVKALGKTAEEQAERMGAMADRLRNETFEGKALVEALASEKEINRRIVGRTNEVGKELGAMRKTLDTAAERPSMGTIARRFEDEVVTPALKMPGAERELQGAERYLSDMIKKGGEAPSFETLHAYRRKLDGLAKYGPSAPKAETEAYRALRTIVEEEFTTAGERAAKEIGGTFADNYALKKALYADLATARSASNRAVGRGTGNNAVSITDVIAGAGAMSASGPVGLAAVGLNVVRRKYGNQIAAHVLDTATRMDTFQRAAAKLDGLLSDGTKAFVSGSKKATRAAKPVTTEEIRALREATRSPEAVTARVAEHLGDMSKYAPKVAQEIAATASRAAAWAQHILPKETAPIAPQFGKPKIVPLSDEQRLTARHAIETMADGSVVVDRLRDGTLTDTHVATLRFVHPETYAKIRGYLATHTTELAKELSTQQLFRLSILFGEPLTEAALPENTRAFQASFSQGNQAPGPGGSGGGTRMRAGPVRGGGNSATALDKMEAGR